MTVGVTLIAPAGVTPAGGDRGAHRMVVITALPAKQAVRLASPAALAVGDATTRLGDATVLLLHTFTGSATGDGGCAR